MRKILVATHASFAQGIYETLKFIMGDQDNVNVMCAYLTQDFNINLEVDNIVKSLNERDELIVLVDLFGGSVSNAFSSILDDPRIHVITGVNFPMLLDIALNQEQDIEEVIQKGMNSAKEGIVYVNQKLKEVELEKEDF